MAPTDPPRRGRAGRGMTLPRGGRGRRGGPSVNTPTSEAPTAVMTPITPAAAFPELSIEPPGSARTESSVLDTPVSQTATTPTVSTSMPIGSTAGIAARRARAGLRGAVGARRSVVAPRYRGRRTAEERAALAQAERERFGAELAEKEREARDAARERGRGRGKDRGGVRGRDSHQGRGNRESRWSRGGRGGALQNAIVPTAPQFKLEASQGGFDDMMSDVDHPERKNDLNFTPAHDSDDESDDNEIGPRTDVGSASFGVGSNDAAAGPAQSLQPIRIQRADPDDDKDANNDVGIVATGLSAASRERPPPPPRQWKGVWRDSEVDDVELGQDDGDASSDQEDDDQAAQKQPVFRTQQDRDEYARLKQSRIRLVELLGNMKLDDGERKDEAKPPKKSDSTGKHVSFVDPTESASAPTAPMVAVKPEPADDDDDAPMVDVDVKSELKSEDDATVKGETDTDAKADPEIDPRADRLFLFQFPPLMPRILPRSAAEAERAARLAAEAEARATVAAVSGTTPGETSAAGDGDSAGFPPPHSWFEPHLASGRAGRLRVHKSGKVTIRLGGNNFVVHEGIESGFLQTGMVVKLPKAKRAKKVKKEKTKKDGAVKTEPGADPDPSDSDGDKDDDNEDNDNDDVGAYSMGPISGKLVASVYWEKTLGKESTLFH